MDIQPFESTLGALVTGIALADLDQSKWLQIESAFLEHAVLIFPGQYLSNEQQACFAIRFGEMDQLGSGKDAIPLCNQRADGSLRKKDEHLMQILRGNEGWHTDGSYMSLAAKVSMLSAHVVPSTGGETEWADARAGYDVLSSDTQDRISDLAAQHSLTYAQAKIGHKAKAGASYGLHEEEAPLRPLVKVHPITGRRGLVTGRHAFGIPGLEEEESGKLIEELLDSTCQPQHTHRHSWQVGDIAVWDNRAVLHRARPYNIEEPRLMYHTRIAGDPGSELSIAR